MGIWGYEIGVILRMCRDCLCVIWGARRAVCIQVVWNGVWVGVGACGLARWCGWLCAF